MGTPQPGPALGVASVVGGVALLLAGLGAGAMSATNSTASSAQAAVRFEVFCGTADPSDASREHYASGQAEDRYRPCICGEDERSPPEKGLLDRAAELFDEATDAGASRPCLTSERRTKIERWAADAFTKLMAHDFESPSPNYLGPVVTGFDGLPRVRLYADSEMSGNYASALQPCAGGRLNGWLSRISFRPEQYGYPRPPPPGAAATPTLTDAFVYRTLAHELFHVIQNAQPFATSPPEGCPGPEWLRESAADAVAADLMRQAFPSYRPPLSRKGSRSVYGLRPYNRAFTWEDTDQRDRYTNKIVPHYTLSSFWMYLSERFSGGSHGYLARFYDARGTSVDWLDWMNDRLQASVGHPLYLLFPDFVAHYARWGERRYEHLGEEIWLRESFPRTGGPCQVVELVGDAAKAPAHFEFEPISASCLLVRVGGVPEGRKWRVQFMTHDDDEARLDALHLSIARTTATEVSLGGPLDCYDQARPGASGQPCVVKKFVGKKRTKGPRAGLHPATWWGKEFRSASGWEEILYLVSHSPVSPTDVIHDRGDGIFQTADFTVSLHLTKVSTSEEGPAENPSAAVNGVPEGGTVPMTGVDAGPMAMASQALLRPGSIFPELELPADVPLGDGIRTLTLRDAPPGAMPASGLEIRLHLMERPITFGATGVYRAYVMGSDAPDLGAGGVPEGLSENPQALSAALASGMSGLLLNVPADDEAGSATVEVVEFSDDLLHLRIDGSYCRGSELDIRAGTCRSPETFQAEILRPFGWTYDPDQEFASIDTPGMREYRRYLPYPQSGALADLPDPPRPPPSAPAPASGPPPGAGPGAVGEPFESAPGSLVLGGETYRVTPSLCDLPDRMPGVVLSGEAVAADGSRGMVMVTQGRRPGGVVEEQVVLSAEEGSYSAAYRRTDEGWERLTPTEAADPSSPLDRGRPEWRPADGPLLVTGASSVQASARFHGPGTGIEGWEGTLKVNCDPSGGA